MLQTDSIVICTFAIRNRKDICTSLEISASKNVKKKKQPQIRAYSQSVKNNKKKKQKERKHREEKGLISPRTQCYFTATKVHLNTSQNQTYLE